MIKITIVNILGLPNSQKKDMTKLLKYTNCKRRFVEDCLEVYKNCADHLRNNLRLNEIFILIFFQFHCKISRNKLKLVVKATYRLQPS